MNSFVAYLKGEHTSVRGIPSLFRLPVVQTHWIAGCHLQILPDCSCLACSASHSTVMLKCTSWIECTALCFKLWYWVSVENSPVKMIAKMTDLTAGMPQTPSFCQLYTFGFSGQGKLSSSFHWKCHSSLEAIFLFIYLKIYLFSFRFRLYIPVLLYNSWKIIHNFDMTNTAAFKVWVWQIGEGLG